MRIGIVGTGIAGLTAGWLLERRGHRITLFEKQPALGMDAHSTEVQIDGEIYRSDVPPRMFNSAQWPKLTELYQSIGVESQSVVATKSFSTLGEQSVLNLGSSYVPKLAPGLLLNPVTREILADVRKMMNQAKHDLEKISERKRSEPFWVEPTFSEYLDDGGYSVNFVEQFLYPALSSTVCTCSYDSLGRFPASVLLGAMLNITAEEGLFRTSNGTRDVVSRLTEKIETVHLNSPVRRVLREDKRAVVETTEGKPFEFDHVILATQANTTLNIVEGMSEAEHNVFGSFKYENVETIVHTDESLMPARGKDWATFNQISNDTHTEAMCSIWLNKFYPEWNLEKPVFQTIMPIIKPDSNKVLSIAKMQRPVVQANSFAAQRQLAELHREPGRRIWFTGSYASPGVPLLESGVCASLEIVELLAFMNESSLAAE